jgi:uncharacterized membrane protein
MPEPFIDKAEPNNLFSNKHSKVERRRQFYRSFEAQALKNRSLVTRIADDLTSIFGSTPFLIINFLWFAVWIIINLGLVPSIVPFDPYPFGFLTMVVSLEAIFLSIVILVSQNRSSYVDTIREELHLQINLIAEEEITKSLKLLAEIREKMGITTEDPELNEMVQRINTGYIEKALVNQIDKAHSSLTKKVVDKMKKDFPDLLDPLKMNSK